MTIRLTTCGRCKRHVLRGAPCPFCAVGVAASVLGLVGCPKPAPEQATADAGAAAAAQAPTPDAAIAAERDAGNEQTAGNLMADAGLTVPGDGGNAIGLRGIGNMTAVYGPAPQDARGGLADAHPNVGDVSVDKVTAPAVPNAERIVAGARGRLRLSYERGLASDPLQKGKPTFTLNVAPNGEVTSVTAANETGLAPAVVAMMTRAFGQLTFDPPTAPHATVVVQITCSVKAPGAK